MFKFIILSLGISGLMATSAMVINAATEPAPVDDLAVVSSAALGTDRNLPWSEPVQIDDPFEGSFIGVFDRHSFFDQFLNVNVRIEVQSLWSQDFIRVLSIVRDRDCLSQSAHISANLCSEFNNTRNVTELFLKIDDDVFQIPGQSSTFPVSDELAIALQAAPTDNIEIRLVTENGETIDSEIGQATVEAWKTVYMSQEEVSGE